MSAVVGRLRGDLEAMCRETLAGLARERPELGRHLPPELLEAAVRGTHERAIDLLAGDASAAPADRVAEFGRRAAHLGVGPEDMMAGYRIGADIANARVRAVLLEQGAEAATVLGLWAWSTRFFDDLAGRTIDGVRRETVAQHGRRARARQALADALLGGGAEPPSVVEVGWTVPGELIVAVSRGGDLDPPEDQGIVARRDGRLLVLCRPGAAWLTAPGAPIAVGPTVDAADARTSWRAALDLAELAERQPGGGGPVVLQAGDHLVDLVLAGNAWAAAALPGRVLGPLGDAPRQSRALLRETLRAWLDDPGRPQAIAGALGLHPQTVQYRLRRLRAVFGAALDDPEERLALRLALRIADGPALGRPSA